MLQKISLLIEKFLKTDSKYLLRGSFWLGLGQAVSMLTSLATLIAFANLLPAQDYGSYKFILSGISLITALSLSGIVTTIVQSTARGYKHALIQGFRIHLKWAVVPVMIALMIGIYYLAKDNVIFAAGFIIAGLITPFSRSFELFDSYYVGESDFKTRTLYSIIQQMTQAAAVIIALFLTQNIEIIILVYLGSLATTSCIFYLMTKKKIEIANPEKEKVDFSLKKNGIALTGIDLLTRTAEELDKIVVFQILGPVQLATYLFALAPVAKIKGMEVVIKNLSLPKLSVRSISELQQSLPRKIIVAGAGALILAMGYIIVAPFLFTWLFPQYISAVPYTQALSALIVFSYPSSIIYYTLLAHVQKKALLITKIIPPLIKIGLIAVLIPLLGIWGAVFATIGFYIVSLGVLVIIFFNLKDTPEISSEKNKIKV